MFGFWSWSWSGLGGHFFSAALFAANTEAYRAELARLSGYARTALATVPPEARVLYSETLAMLPETYQVGPPPPARGSWERDAACPISTG